jgi:NADH:ubiquinone oxidoreductase subunit 6 (subunit J)
MIRALLHSVGRFFTSDGAWWILALDGILLIPLLFAMFFYPFTVLLYVGAVAVLTVVAIALVRVVHTHQHTHP